MPAKPDVSPQDVSRMVERNTNAVRAVTDQLQRMQQQLADFQSRQGPGFAGQTAPQAPQFGTGQFGTPQFGTQIGVPFAGLGEAAAPRASAPLTAFGPFGSIGAIGPTGAGPQFAAQPFAALPTAFPTAGATTLPPSFGALGQAGQLGSFAAAPTGHAGGTGSFGQVPTGPTGPSAFQALGEEPTRMASEKRDLPPVARQPTVDLIDNEEAFLLEADLPGVEKDDLEVTVYGNTVTIQARAEPGAEEGAVLVGERLPVVFRRTLRLPAEVDAEAVKAKLKDGILALTLPKLEKGAGPHRVSIQ